MDNKPFTTLNFTDLGSPFGGPNEDPPGTPTISGEGHIGPPTPHESNNSTPVSKSAFIELQQHGYGPLRTSYQHHFNSPAGNAHTGPTAAHDTGFPSPRGALGAYPFPPMHQNSYAGYHLGTYAANCPPSPKDDGKWNFLGIETMRVLYEVRRKKIRISVEKCSNYVKKSRLFRNSHGEYDIYDNGRFHYLVQDNFVVVAWNSFPVERKFNIFVELFVLTFNATISIVNIKKILLNFTKFNVKKNSWKNIELMLKKSQKTM